MNLREQARGQDCTINIPSRCNFNPETTILAHYRKGFYGMGIKPHDLLAAYACSTCHDIVDGRDNDHDLSAEEIDMLFKSGVIKTLQRITRIATITFKQK